MRALKRKKSKKSKSSKKAKPTEPSAPSRTSMRLRGLAPDGSEVTLDMPRTAEDRQKEYEARVVECREARLRAAAEVAKNGQNAAEMENSTGERSVSVASCVGE